MANIVANISIREPIQPVARGERYEDPVFDALEEAGLGGPGEGAGSTCSKEGEVEEVDFDVELTSLAAVPLIVSVLEDRGAPKGSVVRYTQDGKSIEVGFGVTEGVAVYLDGVNQAPEVYATTSLDELLDQIMAALDDSTECRGSWQGPRETALYLYGDDAEKIYVAIEPVLRAYPLSRNCRVIIRHGDKSVGPQEVSLSSTPS